MKMIDYYIQNKSRTAFDEHKPVILVRGTHMSKSQVVSNPWGSDLHSCVD
jgi:hypothetical protein